MRSIDRVPQEPYTLLHVDDVSLASSSKDDLGQLVQRWNDRLMQQCFRLNLNTAELSDLNISLNAISQWKTAFGKLHSLAQPGGNCVPQLVLERLKYKIYHNIIHLSALYDSVYWATIKENEQRPAIMETKTLHCTNGVPHQDHIGNEVICDRYVVALIMEKFREKHLRWYGQVIRTNENSLGKTNLNIEVDGKRPKGRPKQRWLDTLDDDLKASSQHLSGL